MILLQAPPRIIDEHASLRNLEIYIENFCSMLPTLFRLATCLDHVPFV